MDFTFKKIKNSEKPAHQSVSSGDVFLGEVWREQVTVTVSKLTAPRRTALKWRWFAKRHGETTIIGRGTRVAALLGAGFASKAEAAAKLMKAD